jgi:lipopolysaccharide/colanic/teichoic acid biosynthesis glycosyltransferase
VFSGLLLITVYPIFRLSSAKEGTESSGFLVGLSHVFGGRMSLVGPPLSDRRAEKPTSESLFLGKPGLCGLVQLQQDGTLSDDEMNQYYLYYARNQSVLLDLEILIKTWLRFRDWRKKAKRK